MAKKRVAEKKEVIQEHQEKQVRLVWGTDEGLDAVYANNLYISHSAGLEFHLIFGHMSPPLTLGKTEEELPDMVEIKPVAKIVISPEAMKNFVEAMVANFDKFEGSQANGDSDD